MTFSTDEYGIRREPPLNGAAVESAQLAAPTANDVGPHFRNAADTSTPPVEGRAPFRLPISYRGIAGLAASLDFLIVMASAVISDAIYHFTVAPITAELSRNLAAAVFVAILFVFTTKVRKLYEPSRLSNWNEQIQNILGAWCGAFLLLASGVFTWGVGKELSRGTILVFWALGGTMLLAHRAFWRTYLPRALSTGALKGRRAIVLSWAAPIDATFTNSIAHRGYVILAQFLVDVQSAALQDAVKFAMGAEIDDIFLVPNNLGDAELRAANEILRSIPVPVTLIPDAVTAALIRSPRYELGRFLAVEIQRPPLGPGEQAYKRVFDVVFASVALLVAAPFLAIVAAAILIDSPGPVLFLQTRLSFNGRPFKIYKFRTMRVLEDGEIVQQAKRGDRRVTRVGRWLRRMSIDELPQLLNVLRGEMSLVGPRPHAAAHHAYFEKCVENYAFRHHVKSGITGWAQVQGARGETDTVEKIQRRVDLDLWYINNWSPQLDVSILLRTIGVVLRGKNAV